MRYDAKEFAIDVADQCNNKEATTCGWPLVWDTIGRCYMYTARDNRILQIDSDDDANPHMMTREIALQVIADKFDDYHHLGSKPNIMERRATVGHKTNDVTLKRPVRRNNETDKSNPVPTPRRHKLQQATYGGSGSRYDLVCATNESTSAISSRDLSDPLLSGRPTV